MPFGGTFCPEEWSYAGFISMSPGRSVTSRAPCAKTSVPATELGSVRTWHQKRKIPRQIGKEAIPLAVCMCTSRLLPGAAMSTGYSTSYGVCCGRQACLQHGKEPGGTGCAGHARAPVQHTSTGSCSDPAPAGLEGSLRLTFPGSPGILVFPASSSTHTLLLLPQHTRQEMQPSVLTQSM